MMQRQGPNRPPGPGGPGRPAPTVDQGRLRRILVDGDDEELVKFADEVGRRLKDEGLRASQVRRFFAEVRRLGDEARVSGQTDGLGRIFRRLNLLRPKLAYQTGRNIAGMGQLRDVLDPAIQLVIEDRSKPDRLVRFVELFEAILAYHKFYGGGD